VTRWQRFGLIAGLAALTWVAALWLAASVA